jgi:MFS family permease
LADRKGRKRLIVAAISVVPLLFLVWPFVENWLVLLMLYSVAFDMWSLTWAPSLALLSDTIPDGLRGSAFGIRMTAVRLGFTLGPFIGGLVYSSVGHNAPFFTAAMFYAMAVPFALSLKENKRK